jgi:hypothetical protein
MLLFQRYYLVAMSTTWFHLFALSEALDMGSNKETSAEAATSHESGRWRTFRGAFRSGATSIKRVPWTPITYYGPYITQFEQRHQRYHDSQVGVRVSNLDQEKRWRSSHNLRYRCLSLYFEYIWPRVGIHRVNRSHTASNIRSRTRIMGVTRYYYSAL